jgi:hypothetical protein
MNITPIFGSKIKQNQQRKRKNIPGCMDWRQPKKLDDLG